MNKKEDTPFVSIVMPAFNEGKNIKKTVESVQNLDYPADRMEIVLVDDGSTDDTFEVIKKMALKDPRIKGFTKPNGGTADAKNFGIKNSRGDFVISLDSDSYVAPDALKHMIGYMRDKRVMAVTPSMSVYKPKGFLQNLQYVEYTLGIYLRKVFGLLNCIHVTPGPFSVYRKSFFEKYGYFETGNLTEDIEIALRIQKKGYKIENSIHAGVYTVAPNNFKALMNQRMRWYYGFVQNVLRNKDLFKPKYGYLALIMLPAAFISVALTILIFFYFIYQNIHFLIDKIIYVIVTKTDLFTVELKTIKMQYITDVLTNFITNPFLLLAVVALVLTVISIMFAKRGVRDKYHMFWPFILFALTYWFFYAFWWLAPFIWKGLGGKIRWGKKWY